MIALYKLIDGKVASQTFTAEDAKAALARGWKDNPTDAEKRTKKAKR